MIRQSDRLGRFGRFSMVNLTSCFGTRMILFIVILGSIQSYALIARGLSIVPIMSLNVSRHGLAAKNLN